ncbi:radical SAM protein [Desulfurivibrio alkaliphilus]|uniref:Arsenite methyltransferase n=1 Tax=Desulfurivibrio alkaliphilus (strain DSM 19089 / UNIQEM U267 / AHT2) TaxID=589865 RepID=D6Z1C9_DESAT|nr:radical SAM protein [Desulfurivibrio alkaliphilus]ADH85384.1 Arsenite methyltransferase [Desulfurivibrio alkaliphilus AHT 2]
MLDEWRRLTCDSRAIYVNSEKPDWVVVNNRADGLLQALQAGGSSGSLAEALCAAGREGGLDQQELATNLVTAGRLLARLGEQVPPYPGRGELLREGENPALKECWFHLTNNCNLACRHCLFASRPGLAAESLPAELLRRGLAEAREMGCRLFYFTGGEPFTYPDFTAILTGLLADPDHHAVVLTNGLLLVNHLAELQKLPPGRLHLQLSLDGLAEQHDQLRGRGSFTGLVEALQLLRRHGLAATLAVAVNRINVEQLPAMVDFAAEQGVGNLHLIWHFVRGIGSREQFVAPAEILPRLLAAQERAEERGVLIDNVETLRGQVFSSPGTRYDLANTAWESLTVGPDGHVYPSPALMGVKELDCGPLSDGLARIWQQSPVLRQIRATSLQDSEAYRQNPLKLLIGGGDLDHSYLAGGAPVGHDPYLELYNGLALWLIARQADSYPVPSPAVAREPAVLLAMGEVRHDCPDGGAAVSFTHCNCVISLADEQGRGHGPVREFYAAAARSAQDDIVNPLAPEQGLATYIPEESRRKSYGCGSPVHDAAPQPGQVLVDLGSGSGVECFIAARAVGPSGRVFGIDMTDEMLALAEKSKATVVRELGVDNVAFKKGLLEAIPLPDDCADLVISNCVINLSPDKRRVFHEIWRILKPGGRLVVSDIVTDEPVPVAIKNNTRFRGECLGGAMHQEELLAMLHSCGFAGSRLLKRFPYRQEGDTRFYSLTFAADKPVAPQNLEVIYRGPFAAVQTAAGVLLRQGQRLQTVLNEAERRDEAILVLDEAGAVTNLPMSGGCCPPASPEDPASKEAPAGAASAPLEKTLPLFTPGSGNSAGGPGAAAGSCCPSSAAPAGAGTATVRHQAGCLVCGEELRYSRQERDQACHYCGVVSKTNAVCRQHHYVCDDCHQRDGLSVIRAICSETSEQDMLALLAKIRHSPAIPMHGPEHHALVPGVILATYRNRGGELSREAILTGIARGSQIPGGACGFWGNCGAAVGAGIAFSILLDATPLSPKPRRQAQEISARILSAVASVTGARCCRREAFIVLREAAAISRELLPVSLLAEADFTCDQAVANPQCIRRQCPLLPL